MDVKDSLASFSPSSSSSSVRVTMKKACMEGDVQMVSKLIRAIHWELDEDKRTPLAVACRYGQRGVVKKLLFAAADPNIRHKGGMAPLHSACFRGHADIVMMLLGAKADINAKTKDGLTPLHLATLRGHENIVSLLLSWNADLSAKSDDGKTAFDLAPGHPQIRKMLQNPPPLSLEGFCPEKKPIVISGGGPVGLTLAAILYELFPFEHIFVMNLTRRWEKDESGLWKFRGIRRSQVVTVQDSIVEFLPKGVKELYQNIKSFKMWSGSKNIAICELEDALLLYLQTTCPDRVHFSLRAAENEMGEKLNRNSSVEDLEFFYSSLIPFSALIVCEGSQSLTRELFLKKGSVTLDSLGSKRTKLTEKEREKYCQLDNADYALGVELKFPPKQLPSNLSAINVALTVAQTRYLFNIGENIDGTRGYMNMRLTRREYEALVGTGSKKLCTFSSPCWVHAITGDEEEKIHLIQDQKLREDVAKGLQFFGVTAHHVGGVNSFFLKPEYVYPPVCPAFTPSPPPSPSSPSSLVDERFKKPSSVIFVGDSCMSHHFWPGRGLNTGLTCAIALGGFMKKAKSFSPFHLGEYVDFVEKMIEREMFERSAYLLDPEIRLKEDSFPSGKDQVKMSQEMIERVSKLLRGLQKNASWPHEKLSDAGIEELVTRSLSCLNGRDLAALMACSTWPRGKKDLPDVLPPFSLGELVASETKNLKKGRRT